MRPLTVSHVAIDHVPGHPSSAHVLFQGGIGISGIQVWPARHGPLVLFPIGTGNTSPLSLTPLLRNLVVQAVVAQWRQTRQELARIAA
ncbi:MAG TPA: hypothetical protein PK208_14000 [Fibrobacteria bacterium]|nr:hypothetical protein [Fibrobacteria bacterium]